MDRQTGQGHAWESENSLSIADISRVGDAAIRNLHDERLPNTHGHLQSLGTMSARKLGGGRILGSGKNLSPAAAALPTQRPSVQSPSASSLSVNSSVSTSTDLQDINSRVSFDQIDANGGSSGASGAGGATALFCPICNEEMVYAFGALSLLQAANPQ